MSPEERCSRSHTAERLAPLYLRSAGVQETHRYSIQLRSPIQRPEVAEVYAAAELGRLHCGASDSPQTAGWPIEATRKARKLLRPFCKSENELHRRISRLRMAARKRLEDPTAWAKVRPSPANCCSRPDCLRPTSLDSEPSGGGIPMNREDEHFLRKLHRRRSHPGRDRSAVAGRV